MKIKQLIISTLVLSFSLNASAELLFDPTSNVEEGEMAAGGYYGSSTVEYDIGKVTVTDTNNATFQADLKKPEITRKLIGAYGAYGLSDSMKVFAVGALINSSKAKVDSDKTDGDKGNMIGVGVVSTLPVDTDFELKGYGQFTMVNEKYGKINDQGVDVNYKAKGNELLLGVMATKELDQMVLYAAAEFYVLKKLDTEVSASTIKTLTVDMERANNFGVRVGGRYNLDDYYIVGNFAFNHESAFMAGVGMNIE